MSNSLNIEFGGELIWPGHPKYDGARELMNARFDRKPALIARCLGNADVMAALRWARERGHEVAVRATGYNLAGWSMTDGVVIDLSLMRGARVNPRRRIAIIEGGSTAGRVQREANLFGLAAVTGLFGGTGPGTLMGGGIGHLRNRAGWAADNIVAADLITADGMLVRASQGAEPDLLWALRGAGANFGVVTSLDLQLHPIPPRIVAGAMVWGERRLEEALVALREISPVLPESLSLAAFLKVGDGSAPAAAKAGNSCLELWYCHTGSPDRAETDVGAIRGASPPDAELRAPTRFDQLQFWKTPVKTRRFMDASAVSSFTDEAIAVVADIGRTMPRTNSWPVREILDMRGATSREPAMPSVQPRALSSSWTVRPLTSSDDPDQDAVNEAWILEATQRVREIAAVGRDDFCFASSMSRPAGTSRLRAFYGAEYDRLSRLKGKWDPDNVFRRNQNIPPETSLAGPS